MRNRLISAATVALFAIPPLLDVWLGGWSRVFRYFAADAYLYFAVGRNWAQLGSFTIDQVHPTNGFHPLWQGFVGWLHLVGESLGWQEPAILIAIFLANVVSIALALWLFCCTYQRARGSVPISFLLLPLGFYGLAVVWASTDFGPRGTLWGFVNGMESGFSLLAYAVLVWVMVEAAGAATARSAWRMGAALALLVLARLDNIFLAVAVCSVLAGHAIAQREFARFRLSVLTGVPVLIALVGYAIVNHSTTGMLLPVSALAKFESTALDKLRDLSEMIGLSLHFEGSTLRIDTNFVFRWRLAQIVLPALVAAAALVVHRGAWRQKEMDGIAFVWIASAVFTILLAAYNFWFVPLGAQGHWYFPISVLFSSAFLLDAVARSRRLRFANSPVAGLAIAALSVFIFVRYYAESDSPGPPLFEKFVTEQASLARDHYVRSNPRILSYDDGIIAYATGWPVMTAWGFMLDAEAIRHFNDPDASLLRLAYDRGFDRLSSVYYFDARSLADRSSSASIAKELERQLEIPAGELDDFSFRVDYRSSDGRFAVIQMTPVD